MELNQEGQTTCDSSDKSKKKTIVKSPSTETDSSISITFDSSSDCGYRSEDISELITSSELSTTNSSSELKKSDHNVTFDSGLVSDAFTSSSEISVSEKTDYGTKSKISTFPAFKGKYVWSDIFSQDEDGDTILHLAVVEARSDIIFPLIRLAPHPNFLDLSNFLYQTLLHLATLTGKSNIVRRLVVVGATLDVQDHGGNTPLHIASRNGDLDCVQAILTPITQDEIVEAACSYLLCPKSQEFLHLINKKNYDGQSCVHLAANGGFLKVMECLCNNNADIDDQDGKTGRTALHYAIESGNYELVNVLLSKCHADSELPNYAGQTPLGLSKSLRNRHPADIRKQILDLVASYSSDNSDKDNEIDTNFADQVFQDLIKKN